MAAFMPKVTFARAWTILSENRHFSGRKLDYCLAMRAVSRGVIGVHREATASAELAITRRFTPKRTLGAECPRNRSVTRKIMSLPHG